MANSGPGSSDSHTVCLVEDGATDTMLAVAKSIAPACPVVFVSWALDSIAQGAVLPHSQFAAGPAAPPPVEAAGAASTSAAPSRKRARGDAIPDCRSSKTAAMGGSARGGEGGADDPQPTADSARAESLPLELQPLAALIHCAGRNQTEFHTAPGDRLRAEEVAIRSESQGGVQQLPRGGWHCLEDGYLAPGFAGISGPGRPAASACSKQKGIAGMFQRPAAATATSAADGSAEQAQHTEDVPLEYDYSRWGAASVLVGPGWGGAERQLLALDVDDTLTRTAKSCKVFAESADDWTWWHADVPKVLKRLHDSGMSIALLTNQSGASGGSAARRAPLIRDKLGGIAQALAKEGVPTCVVAATGSHDFFRKPRPGMLLLAQHLLAATASASASAVHSDMQQLCAYVGDAAGRSLDEKTKHSAYTPQKTPLQKSKPKLRADHGVSDLQMACNAGVAFLTPDALFAGSVAGTSGNAFTAAAVQALRSFHPAQVFAEAALAERPGQWAQQVQQVASLLQDRPCVFVSVGAPGSGKSAWASSLCASLGPQAAPAVVNQDTLRSKEKCRQAAEAALLQGQSVIVDATNVSCQVRDDWLQLARQHSALPVAVRFPTRLPRCLHLNAFRGSCPFPLPCGADEQRYVPSRVLSSLQPQHPEDLPDIPTAIIAADPPLHALHGMTARVLRMWLV